MRVCFLTSDGPTEANARLIAAAPDMLDALRWINMSSSPEARQAVRDAIDKAEARPPRSSMGGEG